MSIVEVLLFISLGSAALLSFVPRRSLRIWAFRCAAAAVVLCVIDVALGYARWQMILAYAFVGISFVVTYLRYRSNRSSVQSSWPRRLIAALGVVVVAMLFVAALLPSLMFPLFEAPEPSGPHRVGITDLHLVDGDRAETMTDDPDDRRELMVRVWYPASVDDDAVAEPFLREIEPLFAVFARGAPFLQPFMLSHLQSIPSHGYLDAPLAQAPARFPVLVFSHGNSLYASQNSLLMEHLASHGYVVFSIDHPYQASVVRFPDQRVARYQEQWLIDGKPDPAQMDRSLEKFYRALYADSYDHYREQMGELLANAPASNRGVQLWVDDTAFLLDALERAEAVNVPASRFAGRLDLERIGIFGMSFGGAVAGEFCAMDARCVAGLNMDGLHYGAHGTQQQIRRPFMFIYADQRHAAAARDPAIDPGKATPFRMNDFAYHGTSDLAYFVTIAGASHLGFSDFALTSNFMRGSGLLGTIDPAVMRTLLNDVCLAFFNRTLLNTHEPLLDGGLSEREGVLEFGRRDGRVLSVE